MIKEVICNIRLAEVLSLTQTKNYYFDFLQVVLSILYSPTSLWTHSAQQNWASYTKCFHTTEKVIKQKYRRQTEDHTSLSQYHYTSHLLPRFHQEEK